LSAAGSAVAGGVLLPFAVSVTVLRKLLLAIMILDIPLQIGAHLFWSEELGESGAVGGLEVSVTTVALCSLYLLWFVGHVSRRETGPTVSLSPALPLALYLMFEAVSLLAARNPTVGLYEVFLTVQMLLLYVYLINWVRTRREVAFVIKILLLGLVLEAGIMIAVKISGHDVQIPGLPGHTILAGEPDGAEEFSRLGGTLVSPNVAGSYLSIMLTVVIGLLLLTRLRAWYKTVALISISLGIIALLFTYSREGWLALFCSTVFLCCVSWRGLRLNKRLMVAGAMAAVLVSLLSDTELSRRLRDNDDSGAHSRIALNKVAIRMIEDHPIIGVGANKFTLNLRNYATREFMGEWLYAVHNKYLLIWAETGLGSLLAYLWFLAASLRRGWQCWKHKDPLYSPPALALVCGVCALMICDMFQSDRGRPLVQLLMVLTALIGTTWSWMKSTSNGHRGSPIRGEAILARQQLT